MRWRLERQTGGAWRPVSGREGRGQGQQCSHPPSQPTISSPSAPPRHVSFLERESAREGWGPRAERPGPLRQALPHRDFPWMQRRERSRGAPALDPPASRPGSKACRAWDCPARGGLGAPSGLRHTQSSSSPPAAGARFKIFQRFRSAFDDLFVGNLEAFSRQCSAPVDTTMRVSAESSSADQRDGGAAVEAVLDVAISVQAGNSCRRASGLTPPGNEAAATASTKRHDLSPIILVMTAVGILLSVVRDSKVGSARLDPADGAFLPPQPSSFLWKPALNGVAQAWLAHFRPFGQTGQNPRGHLPGPSTRGGACLSRT